MVHTSDAHASNHPLNRRDMIQLTGADLVAIIAASAAYPLWAQDQSNGADNFFTSSQLDAEAVRFPTQYRTTVAGNLYLPRNLSAGARLPAIVAVHLMGAAKEQSADLCAQKITEQCFVPLSIDPPFWGPATARQ
jgi:hypothetical protein